MLSFDITASKFFVYSEGGLLFQRYSYEDKIQEYGHPIAVSANGCNFVF